MPRLQQGRIVWIRVQDPTGRNVKERPAVIVTATEEIVRGEPIVGVAITTQLPKPLPDNFVELPWHRTTHPKTGLKKRCAAKCDWLIEFAEEDVIDLAGIVPIRSLLEIIDKLPR